MVELFAFAFLVGLVSAGLISSMYEIATEDAPRLELLTISDFLTPIRVLVLVFAAPVMLFSGAFRWTLERSPIAIGFLVLGCAWSFFQGVFILTTVVGLQ